MNVDQYTAYELLKAFAQMEFALKKIPKFIQGDSDRPAQVQWGTVGRTLAAMPASTFLDEIPAAPKQKLLAGRNRPMKQLVVMSGVDKTARFRPVDLPRNDAAALLEAARRVRNNLFHGGKENPADEHYSGEDQEWAEAALVVVQRLIPIVGNELA